MYNKNKLFICGGLCALSFLTVSCSPNFSHKNELGISINDDGTVFSLKRSEKVRSVGMFAIWEKDTQNIVWAISGVYGHINEVGFGEPPKAYRTEAGFIDDILRQLYPKDNEGPCKLSQEKTYCLIVEITINYMLIERSLDMVAYEISAQNGKFVMTERTGKNAFKLPNSVHRLWEELAE